MISIQEVVCEGISGKVLLGIASELFHVLLNKYGKNCLVRDGHCIASILAPARISIKRDGLNAVIFWTADPEGIKLPAV